MAVFDSIRIVIPARGGSRGIVRKNLRPLGGKPLLRHILDTLDGWIPRNQIIVSTDDDLIAHMAEPFAMVHRRSPETAADSATLDEVAVEVAQWLTQAGVSENDFLLTIQPTSPFLSRTQILCAAEKLTSGAASVLSVKDDRHLRWKLDRTGNPVPMYEARVNRQWLPETYTETGGLIGCKIATLLENRTRIVSPIALVILDEKEGLDIDSFADWKAAEYYATLRRIVIRADAAPGLGMGHVHRAMALGHELAEHDVRIITRSDGDFQLGSDFLDRKPYNTMKVSDEAEFFSFLDGFKPHITFLDNLDTEMDYVLRVKKASEAVVSLEDLGPGAQYADVVINDLYTDLFPKENHWYGVDVSILAPPFEEVVPRTDFSVDVKSVLVTFGGTDPSRLTGKALAGLSEAGFNGEVTVVLGPGYANELVDLAKFNLKGRVLQSVTNMALLMRDADLAMTSGGRTVTELMTLGIPTLVACQNLRELRHTHASSPFGVINLGLGEYLEPKAFAQHLSMLFENHDLRMDMRRRALRATRNRSNREIVQRIFDAVAQNR